MSAHAKKLRTDDVEILIDGERRFVVPKNTAKGILFLIENHEINAEAAIPWRDANKSLLNRYGEAGAILRGARAKSELSQEALAEKLGMPQSHVSEMENGKRTIGKAMAKRLAKVLKVDYRVFL
jgi:ribosome-binding protein aMBF1 (putative translation factor)